MTVFRPEADILETATGVRLLTQPDIWADNSSVAGQDIRHSGGMNGENRPVSLITLRWQLMDP